MDQINGRNIYGAFIKNYLDLARIFQNNSIISCYFVKCPYFSSIYILQYLTSYLNTLVDLGVRILTIDISRVSNTTFMRVS